MKTCIDQVVKGEDGYTVKEVECVHKTSIDDSGAEVKGDFLEMRVREFVWLPGGVIDTITHKTFDSEGEMVKVKTVYHKPRFRVLEETPDQYLARIEADERKRSGADKLEKREQRQRRKGEIQSTLKAAEAKKKREKAAQRAERAEALSAEAAERTEERRTRKIEEQNKKRARRVGAKAKAKELAEEKRAGMKKEAEKRKRKARIDSLRSRIKDLEEDEA